MKHPQFEAVKVAIKQDKTGYILTLNIHPDEIDERIMRDFVGSRYMVVMARINDEEKPMNREQEGFRDPVKAAALLCRDPGFAEYLLTEGKIFDDTEDDVTNWLRGELGIESRSHLKGNADATHRLWVIEKDYKLWKQNA